MNGAGGSDDEYDLNGDDDDLLDDLEALEADS